MTALLACVLMLSNGQGIYASAKENSKTAEFFFLEEDVPAEILDAEEPASEETGALAQDEITEDSGDLQEIPAWSEDGGQYPDTILEDAPGDILIEGMKIAEVPGSTDLSEINDTWSGTALHKAGLAADTSGAAPVSGGINAAAETAVYDTCYGNQLEGESRKIYDEMKWEWEDARGTEEIVYPLSEPVQVSMSGPFNKNNPQLRAAVDRISCAVSDAIDAFLYDYPDVFWASGVGFEWETSYTSNYRGTTARIDEVTLYCSEEYYDGARQDVGEFYSAVDYACEEIEAELSAESSQEAVLKAIHDYICGGVSYDQKFVSPYAHTAAGFFLYPEEKIVCEGYAKAFKILCDRFGIECALIVGDADGPHMWNYVRMEDGVWYLVDATWDDQDQIGEITDTYFLAGSTTIGYDGISIEQERVIHKKFSDGVNAKEFEIPMLSAQKYAGCVHDWEEDPEKREEPSCEEDGKAGYVCRICGSTEVRTLQALGHSWSEWTTEKEATVFEPGSRSGICSVCGTVRTQEIPQIAGFAELNLSSIQLKEKESTTAVKVIRMAEGDEISSWESSDAKIVSVNSEGEITGEKAGTAEVTVTLKSGASASVMVTVRKEKAETTAITVTTTAGAVKNKKLTLKKGGSVTLIVTLIPAESKDKISFSSSNSKIVKVNKKGKLVGKKAGSAKITVKAGKKKTVITVTVKK